MVCIYPCVIVTIDTQNNNQQLTNFWQLILVAFLLIYYIFHMY